MHSLREFCWARAFRPAGIAVLVLFLFLACNGMDRCPVEALQFKSACSAEEEKEAKARQVLMLLLAAPAAGGQGGSGVPQGQGEDGGGEEAGGG